MSPLLWKLVGVIALVSLAWLHGFTKGKQTVQREWDAATVEAERQEQAMQKQNREASGKESASFERERIRLSGELTKTRNALSIALRTPLECEAGDGQTIGDVVVPSSAIDSLRNAATGKAGD